MSDKGSAIQKSFNPLVSSQKHEERAIQIRKDRRSMLLSKRREQFLEEPMEQMLNPPLPPASPGLFQELAEQVKNGNDQDRLEATRMFRRYLSQDINPPNAYVIAVNVLPYFVSFLNDDNNFPLQFEAAWALSNVASGSSDDTLVVVNAGAIDGFIHLLNSSNNKIKEQAIWGLANIAGDNRDYSSRDYILKAGVMDHLLNILNDPMSKKSLVATSAWCLSNLCRGRRSDRPDFNIISKALPTLAHLLDSSEKEVVIDACWAFSFVADGQWEHINAILELGVVNRIIYILGSPNFSLQAAALRAAVNIAAGNEMQTQSLLDAGILPILKNLIESPSRSIKKEAIWTLSNITAGTNYQIDAVLKTNLLPKVISILNNETFEIQKEACWTVCNAICGGTKEHIYTLASMNAVEAISLLILEQTEVRLLKMIIESLTRIFRIGDEQIRAGLWDVNLYIDQFIECGGDDKLRELNITDDSLYQIADNFIREFFMVNSDESDSQYPSFPTDAPMME